MRMKIKMNGNSLLGCKRGQFIQLSIIIVILSAAGILYIFLQTVSDDMNTSIQADSDMSSEAKQSYSQINGAQGSVFDSGIAIILVGAWLLCLGLAYNSQSSPLLLVIAIFVIVSLGFVAMILSNAWDEFSTTAGLSDSLASYPITNFILSNYLAVFLVMGFSTVIVGMSRGGGF